MYKGIISAVKLPFFIVLTKIDKVSDSCLAQVQSSLFDLIRTKMQRAPVIIKTTSKILILHSHFYFKILFQLNNLFFFNDFEKK